MKTLLGEVFVIALLGILSVAEGIRLVSKKDLQTLPMCWAPATTA